MSNDEIRQRIKEAVSRIAGIAIEQIPDDARLVEDLGLDSLAIIESLVYVEHEFRIQPEEQDLEAKVRSIDDAVHLLQTQLMRKAG